MKIIHALIAAILLLCILCLGSSFFAKALSLDEVIQQSPAFHLISDIYILINNQYHQLSEWMGFEEDRLKINKDLDLQGNKITGLATPSNPQDAVNLETLEQMLDNKSSGFVCNDCDGDGHVSYWWCFDPNCTVRGDDFDDNDPNVTVPVCDPCYIWNWTTLKCEPVPYGQDPKGDCGGSCCAYCDGNGGCTYAPEGTKCDSPGTPCNAKHYVCDGKGGCWAPWIYELSPCDERAPVFNMNCEELCKNWLGYEGCDNGPRDSYGNYRCAPEPDVLLYPGGGCTGMPYVEWGCDKDLYDVCPTCESFRCCCWRYVYD